MVREKAGGQMTRGIICGSGTAQYFFLRTPILQTVQMFRRQACS